MNNLTSLFSSIIASFLVTLYEGIFLFVILIPIINRISHRIGFKINYDLYLKKNKKQYFESSIKYPSYHLQDANGNLRKNPNYEEEMEIYWDKINNEYYSYKNIFTPTEKTIFKYGAVDEELFLKTQKKIPYIMYALIMLVLVIGLVIIIIISKTYKIDIDYKISIIISLISFILICGFATTILWFSVFSQSYKLDINKRLFKSLLDTYVNL
jgi:hypothetical protein